MDHYALQKIYARLRKESDTEKSLPGYGQSDFSVVRDASRLMLRGFVLHCGDVTVGKGQIIDWRTVKSGEIVATGPAALLAIQACRLVGSGPVADSVLRIRMHVSL